jgi:hypothetical protein
LNIGCQYPKDRPLAGCNGTIFKDKHIAIVTEADANAVIDQILDHPADPVNHPHASAAAVFLCKKLFLEFTGDEHEHEAWSCAEALSENSDADSAYQIMDAIEYVLKTKEMYCALGKKPRWPLGMLAGADIDMNLKLNKWQVEMFLHDGLLKQLPFHPPDVNGWEIHAMWTLNTMAAWTRLSRHFMFPRVWNKHKHNVYDFQNNPGAFEREFADFHIAGTGDYGWSGLTSVGRPVDRNDLVYDPRRPGSLNLTTTITDLSALTVPARFWAFKKIIVNGDPNVREYLC